MRACNKTILGHLRWGGETTRPLLTVHVAPGVERWAPRADELALIESLLSRPTELFYWPRSAIQAVWAEEHDGQAIPQHRTYLLRAWAKDGKAHLFADPTETKDSVLWLTLHELTHLELLSSPYIAYAFRSEPRSELYMLDDAAHEARGEEQLANAVADRLAPKFGISPGLNRLWWRARVNGLGLR